MITSPLSSIWFNQESKSFYQIPTEFKFLEGEYSLERFDGVKKTVQEEALKEMLISHSEVEESLKAFYESSKAVFGKAMAAKTQFSLITKETNFDEIEDLFEKLKTDSAYASGDDWFNELKDLTENANGVDEKDKKELNDSITELKDVLRFLDDDSMKKAAENPEEWAEEMEQKLNILDDLEKKKSKKKKKKKKAKKQEKLNKMIQQKIDEALNKE